MPTELLTERFIASSKRVPEAGKRLTYFDAREPGLALRVTSTGARSWFYVYRPHPGGREQKLEWLSLGSYDKIDLDAARKLAIDNRRAVEVEHRNPAAELRAQREAASHRAAQPSVYTFAEYVKLYETLAQSRKRTWRADMSKIRTYLLPAWGSMPLRDITRTHVHELLDTLVAQRMTIGVNRIQALISRLFTLALDRSLVDVHPASRMEKRFKEQPIERVLSDDELRALWRGLDTRPGRASDALRLRLLLGQRGEEVVGMEWREVDLDAAVWEIAGQRTKNRRPHAVPLAATALAILKQRRRKIAQHEPRVFPGLTLTSDDHRELSAIANGAYEWKDLRRTMTTHLGKLGFDETTMGRVLNHARYTVTARHYNNHAYDAEKRAALDAWDRELAAIIANKPQQKRRKVVPFRR